MNLPRPQTTGDGAPVEQTRHAMGVGPLEPHPPSRRSLGDLEDPEEADTAQHGDAQGAHGARFHQQDLQDAAAHHEAVEAVEDGHEVLAQTQPIHLHQHLDGEEGQQHAVGYVCGVGVGGAASASLALSLLALSPGHDLH